MDHCCLVEKMSDKRFRKTELAIFIAYYTFQDYPTSRKLARRARVSRSTLYRHHPNVTDIPRDYEDYLLKSFNRAMRKAIHNKEVKLKIVILRMLVFIMNNKKILKLLFKKDQKSIIKKMLIRLKPRLASEWALKGDFADFFNVYMNEVVGIIEIWSKQNFSRNKLGITLNDIMLITKSAPKRLAFLIKPS